MEKRHKIWLAGLAVLLVAAIVGVFVVRGQLTDREADYATAMSQLTEQQQSAAELEAQVEQLTGDLEASQTEASGLSSDL